jgi:hypothetical protein
MNIIKIVSLFLLISISSIFAQKKQKIGRVSVSYDTKIENHAVSLSEILNIGVNEALKNNYKTPTKIELKIINSDRITAYDNGGRVITLEYDSLSRFAPPSCAFFICNEIDKLASLVLIKSIGLKGMKKMDWMNQKFRTSWSLYFTSNLIDDIYDITSDTIWPTPYNFKIHGRDNLEKISNNEKSPIYHEINAWIDLGKCIGFDSFADFFIFFKKKGLSQEAFIESLYKFMSIEAAQQWEEKYMKYIIL